MFAWNIRALQSNTDGFFDANDFGIIDFCAAKNPVDSEQR